MDNERISKTANPTGQLGQHIKETIESHRGIARGLDQAVEDIAKARELFGLAGE